MRRQDLKNLKFGQLLVKDYSHRKGKHLYWLCICDCGKETTQCTTNLKRGNVISCGCVRNRKSGERLKGNTPQIKFETGMASFNVLYEQYKYGAKRRDIEWKLTKEEFRKLTEQDCFYCGDKPVKEISRRGTNGSYKYNGVDRIFSEDSYNIENSIPCCTTCNFMKGKLDYTIFLSKVHQIHRNILKGTPYEQDI